LAFLQKVTTTEVPSRILPKGIFNPKLHDVRVFSKKRGFFPSYPEKDFLSFFFCDFLQQSSKQSNYQTMKQSNSQAIKQSVKQ